MRDTRNHLIVFTILTAMLAGFSWLFAQLHSPAHAILAASMAGLTGIAVLLHAFLYVEEREMLREQADMARESATRSHS